MSKPADKDKKEEARTATPGRSSSATVSTDWLLGREGAEPPPPGIDPRAVRHAIESLRAVENVRAGLESALRGGGDPPETRAPATRTRP
jgi:hypothetical protein